MSALTTSVVSDIVRERARQDDKWGEQHHASAEQPSLAAAFYLANATTHKKTNDARVAAGEPAYWDDILFEEVFEAGAQLADEDTRDLEAELIQVAAVCVAWVEDLRSKRG